MSPVEGGVFSVGKRYGSIERDEFCAIGIAAEMSNEGTPIGSEIEDDAEESSESDTPSDPQSS